jgi:hypothetical protein
MNLPVVVLPPAHYTILYETTTIDTSIILCASLLTPTEPAYAGAWMRP